MISGRPATGRRPGLPDRNAAAAAQDAHDSRVQVISAVLYVVGITLGVVGCVGAFLWGPTLWCAPAGLVVIAVSFTISGSRH